MGKALAFRRDKTRFFGAPGTSAELFFGAFAVLDIDARPEPFHDEIARLKNAASLARCLFVPLFPTSRTRKYNRLSSDSQESSK